MNFARIICAVICKIYSGGKRNSKIEGCVMKPANTSTPTHTHAYQEGHIYTRTSSFVYCAAASENPCSSVEDISEGNCVVFQ